MPLPPDRLRELNQKLDTIVNRFDEFMERRKINDDEDEDGDECLDPNEELTPSEERPWYGDDDPREELRQKNLSKRD
jgi:hypothetical protein